MVDPKRTITFMGREYSSEAPYPPETFQLQAYLRLGGMESWSEVSLDFDEWLMIADAIKEEQERREADRPKRWLVQRDVNGVWSASTPLTGAAGPGWVIADEGKIRSTYVMARDREDAINNAIVADLAYQRFAREYLG